MCQVKVILMYDICYTAQEMKEMEARLDCEFGKESDHEGSYIDIELLVWKIRNEISQINIF